MRNLLLAGWLLILPSILLASPVKVAVAANMQYALIDIARIFTQQTGIAVAPSFASSGKLGTQALNGAPYELFLSADNSTTRKLQTAGITANTPKTYAIGSLVLWSLDPDFDAKHWQAWLKNSSGKLAVANANTAPYGQAAWQTLQKSGLLDSVQARLVTGESVGQTAQFVLTRAAQAGFVAKSQVVAPQVTPQGRWIEIPAALHVPIVQEMVLLKPASRNPDAQKLFDFMLSPTAQAILLRYGYRLPTPAA